MNENPHEFPDELISAYLDGELTPVEKARVEEQLMDSAEHRRLFEELKSLRRSLQALPAETLGDDFAARVLRRAERELLADGGAEKPIAEKPNTEMPIAVEATPERLVAAEVVSAAPREVQIDRGTRRGLVWSTLATAAAVGLLTFGPLWSRPSSNVSLRPEVVPPSEVAKQNAATPEPISGPADKSDAKNGREFAPPPAAPPSTAIPPADRGSMKQSVNRAGEANTLQPARESLGGEGEGQKLEKSNGFSGAARYNASSTFNDTDGAATPGALAKDRAERERRQLSQQKEAAEQETADKGGEGAGGGKVAVGDRAAEAFGGALRTSAPRIASRARDKLQVAQSPRAMGVVMLDVKREALTAKFFDQLLARHDIQVELARADQKAEGRDRTDDVARIASEAPTDAPSEERDAATLEEAAAGGGQGGVPENLADLDAADERAKRDANEEHADVDLSYVEATPEQIDALLRDLESQHGDVLAMAYDGVGPGKKSSELKTLAADGARQFRALAEEMEEMKVLELRDEAKLAAAKFAEQNAAAPSPAEKPQASAAAESQHDDQVALSEPQSDAQASDVRKSGVARRLSLQNLAQAEQQLGRGGAVGAAAQPAPAPVATEAPAEAGPAELAADAAVETEAAPANSLTVSPDAEGGTPSPPAANGSVSGDAEDQLAKAKKLNRVRVLFVLRAVASPPAGETAPAEPAPVESPK